jgi:hypothetical protein
MSEPVEPTYSVAVRIRRTIVEEVHVSVAVTDAVVTDDRLDGAKIFVEAVRIGREGSPAWRREGEPVIEVHPLQTPPPDIVGTPRTTS